MKIIKRGRHIRFVEMIKAFACLFMIIDHVGLTIFPDIIILKIIGRLSMPVFAYGIARGFSHSHKRGTETLYIRRMAVLTRR